MPAHPPLTVPTPSFTPVPGVYMVDKPDVNQGRVVMGHLAIERGNPDEAATEMMNDLLGGAGFTSRITARVRADEGLAYSAGSCFGVGVYYPGIFSAEFQSKSESVARATAIVARGNRPHPAEPVSKPGARDACRTTLIEVFPRNFASASATANLFATDELTGRPPDFWRRYRDRVRAVTVADISTRGADLSASGPPGPAGGGERRGDAQGRSRAPDVRAGEARARRPRRPHPAARPRHDDLSAAVASDRVLRPLGGVEASACRPMVGVA